MKILVHPNIVKFREEFVTHEFLFYVIELVDGIDLYQHINQNEHLEESEAGFIMGEILQAVKYLNKCGIIHRDLKPENIMLKLDKTGPKPRALEVKIIDFGFAMYLTEASCCTCCGTISYVAPEIFTGRPYNAKTDIFSLGVILYFMIRGELPFSHHVKEVVIKNIVKGELHLDTDDFFIDVSSEAKDLIRRMLETKVADRIDINGCLEHPFIVQNRRKRRTNGGHPSTNLTLNLNGLEREMSGRNQSVGAKDEFPSSPTGRVEV